MFQTATNGGSGSAVNDGYPLKAGPGTTTGTMTSCPHSYPQPVDRTSPRRSVVYRRGAAGRASPQRRCARWARDRLGTLASLSGRRSASKRHCQKLTVLSRCANRSATLHGVRSGRLAERDEHDGCKPFMRHRARFDPAKSRQYPRTVARTWRYGCDPGLLWRPRRLASETDELTNGDRIPHWHERAWDADAIRNEERQPWPRASGPSSPTTGAARGCMGSGFGCEPGPAGRSYRTGVARAAVR